MAPLSLLPWNGSTRGNPPCFGQYTRDCLCRGAGIGRRYGLDRRQRRSASHSDLSAFCLCPVCGACGQRCSEFRAGGGVGNRSAAGGLDFGDCRLHHIPWHAVAAMGKPRSGGGVFGGTVVRGKRAEHASDVIQSLCLIAMFAIAKRGVFRGQASSIYLALGALAFLAALCARLSDERTSFMALLLFSAAGLLGSVLAQARRSYFFLKKRRKAESRVAIRRIR